MECITFPMQTVFRHDAAETQGFYIGNGLKKPNRVSIRDPALTGTCTYCVPLLLLEGFKVYEGNRTRLMMPTYQVTSSGWILGTGRPKMRSVETWCHKVSGSFLKTWNAMKKPIQWTRIMKGPRAAQNAATLPRGRWCPLMKGLLRNIKKVLFAS